MPVILKKPTTLSNKAIYQFISGDIAYEIADKNNLSDMVTIYKPIIDRISITYTPPIEENFAAIAGALLDEAKLPDQPLFKPAQFSKGKSGFSPNYAINVNFIPGDDGKAILIQCLSLQQWEKATQAGKPKMSLMRFDFNPAKLGDGALLEFDKALKYISLNHFGYADLMMDGRTTRVDIAVDIVGVAPHNLFLQYVDPGKGKGKGKGSSKNKSKTDIYLGVTGRAETFYMNKKQTKKGKLGKGNVTAYNKAQQAIDTGAKALYPGPHTRIEFRIEDKNNPPPPIGLAELSLPFQNLTMYAPTLITPPEPAYLWNIVCEAIRFRGPEKILGYLPDDMKPAFAQALESVKNILWHENLLSKAWPEAVAKLITAAEK